MPQVFIVLGVLFFTGHFLKWFFNQTKIPDLLILVIIGQILGPLTGWVKPEQVGLAGRLLSEMALVVILFEGGLGLEFEILKRSSWGATKLTVLGFVLSVAVCTGVVHLMTPLTWLLALYVGIATSSTSSAVVIPMVKFLSVGEKTKTVLMLESSFNDILVIVLGLMLLEGLYNPNLDIGMALLGVIPTTLTAVALGAAAGVALTMGKARFPGLATIKFSTEAAVCILYGVVGYAGLNGPVAVLAMGLIMGNFALLPGGEKVRAAMRSRELDLLSEMAFLLKVFFFIYLGTMIQWQSIWITLVGAIMTLGIFLSRYFVTLGVVPHREGRLDAITVFAMGPRGLACAVVASLPLQRGIPEGALIQSIAFAAIPLTILATAVLVVWGERHPESLPLFRRYPTTPVPPPESV